MWAFCPSVGASYLFIFLFAITTIGHAAQAIIYRKFYCWVIVMSGLIQTVTYIFRVLSIIYPASYADYAGWFVLILIAPLWTNAFVYMVMGRMVWNFTDDARVLRVRPWTFGMIFVTLDIMYELYYPDYPFHANHEIALSLFRSTEQPKQPATTSRTMLKCKDYISIWGAWAFNNYSSLCLSCAPSSFMLRSFDRGDQMAKRHRYSSMCSIHVLP